MNVKSTREKKGYELTSILAKGLLSVMRLLKPGFHLEFLCSLLLVLIFYCLFWFFNHGTRFGFSLRFVDLGCFSMSILALSGFPKLLMSATFH